MKRINKDSKTIIRAIKKKRKKSEEQYQKDLKIMRQVTYGIHMAIFRGADVKLKVGKFIFSKEGFSTYLSKTIKYKFLWLEKKLIRK